MVLFPAARAVAANFTWDGGGTTDNWNDAFNWSPNTVPPSSADTTLTFAGNVRTRPQQVLGPFDLDALTFDATAGGFIIEGSFGSPLHFRKSSANAAPVINCNTASNAILNLPLVFAETVSVGGSGSGQLDFYGKVTGPGGLNKNNGSQRLRLLSPGVSSLSFLSVNSGPMEVRGSSEDSLSLSATGSTGFGGNSSLFVEAGASFLLSGATLNTVGTPQLHNNASVTVDQEATWNNVAASPGGANEIRVGYAGGVSTLTVRNSSNVNTGTLRLGNSGLAANPGHGRLTVDSQSEVVADTLILDDPLATIGVSLGGSISVGAITESTPCIVTLSDGGLLELGRNDVSSTFGGTLRPASGQLAPGRVNKIGKGTLKLTGASAGMTSTLDLLDGRLGVGASAALGALDINASGGDLFAAVANRTIANHVSIASGKNLGVVAPSDDAHNVTFTGVIDGAGGLAVDAPGHTVTLEGAAAANTFSGTTAVTAGTLVLNKSAGTAVGGNLSIGKASGPGAPGAAVVRLDRSAQIPTAAGVTLYSDGLFNLNGQPTTIGSLTMTGGEVRTGGARMTLGGDVTTNALSGPAVITGATVSGQVDLGAVSRTLTVAKGSGAVDLEVQPAISGGSLVKSGPGTLKLSNPANTFTGGVAINAGTLVVTGDGSLGAPSGNVVINAGNLTFGSSTTTSRTFTMSTAATLAPPTGGTITYAAGATVIGGRLAAGGTHAFTDGATLNGATADTGGTITTAGGVWFANDNFRGSVTQSAGALTIADSLFTSAGSLTVNGRVDTERFENDGVLRINATGTLVNNAGKLALGGASRTTIEAGGSISTAAGTTIEVNGGLLTNNGTLTGTTNVHFNGLATGTGSYGPVNVFENGRFAPGAAAGAAIFSPAAVSASSVSFAPDATLAVEIGGKVAGTSFDQLSVAGSAALDGRLEVTTANGFQPRTLDEFLVLSATSHTGHFAEYAGREVSGGIAYAPVYSASGLKLVATLPGDATLDGVVDFADLVTLAQHYNTTLTTDNWWASGDFSLDGRVDFNDLLALARNYNGSITPASAAPMPAEFAGDWALVQASVPEPGVAVLLAVGLALLLLRRDLRSCVSGRRILLTVSRVASLALVLLLSHPARAANFTWDGGSSTRDMWSDASNWSSDTLPTSSPDTTVTFAGSARTFTSQDLANPFQLNALTFDAGAGSFMIVQNPLEFRASTTNAPPVINQNSASNIYIAIPLLLTDTLSIGGSGSGDVRIGESLTGAGGLHKNGAFRLSIDTSRTNTLSFLSVDSGSVVCAFNTLNLSATGSTGFGGNSSLFVEAGASLRILEANLNTVATPQLHNDAQMTLDGATWTNTAATPGGANEIRVGYAGGTSTLTMSGGAKLNTGGLRLGNAPYAGHGAITMFGRTTQANVDTVILDDNAGAIDIHWATFNVNAFDCLQSGTTITLEDDISLPVNSGTLNVGAGGASSTFTGKLKSAVAGHGILNKLGDGVLTLSGASPDFSGKVVLGGGTLAVANDAALGAGTITAGPGALAASGADRTLANNVSVDAGKTLNLTVVPTDPRNLSLNGVIAGAGGLSVKAPGALVALGGNAANTFTGPTSVLAGTLLLDKSISFALPGDLSIGNADSPGSPNTAVVRLNKIGQISGGANITLYPDGLLDLNGQPATVASLTMTGGDVRNRGAHLTLNGDVMTNASPNPALITGATTSDQLDLGSVTRTFTIARGAATVDLDVAPAIVGSGALVKSGPGILKLSNAANTFSGGVTLNAGTLIAAADGSLGAAANNPLLNAGKLAFASSTTTARTFTMSTAATLAPPTGGTLTYANGATVNGGLLAAGGTHAFTDGSVLSGATATIDSAITTSGVVNFNNANLRGSVTNTAGALTIADSLVTSAGSLTVNAGVNTDRFENDGALRIGAAGKLSNNAGTLVLGAGSRNTIDAGGSLTTAPGTTIELNGGLLVNNGMVTGTTNVHFNGLATGTGTYGPVNLFENGRFAPGASAGPAFSPAVVAASSAAFATDTSLAVEIGGKAPGTTFDQVNVTGQAVLDGVLSITTVNNFSPAPLDSFKIVSFATRTGHFSAYTGQETPRGLAYAPVYSATDLKLIATLPGDANLDGNVDFNDLVRLAQNYNTTLSTDNWWTSADFTLDGRVDFNDLVRLAQNYNTSLAPAAADLRPAFAADWNVALQQSSVPEPATSGLLLIALAFFPRRPDRR